MESKKFSVFGEENKAFIDKLLANGFIRDDANPDYVFSLGGDGTVLSAIHKYIDKIDSIYFVGINYGRLGFYTDFIKDDYEVIDLIKTGNYNTEEFRMLELNANGHLYYALNEVAAVNYFHTQTIDVSIDDVELETFKGTGFIISTPSGSTAYNKSLGGAILAPSIDGFQLTELASINNRVFKTLSSSLVLARENEVSLTFKHNDGLQIQVDGLVVNESDLKTIKIKLANNHVKFITKSNTKFLERVKKSFLE